MENLNVQTTETWNERMAREKKERDIKELAFCKKIEKAFELCDLEVFGIEGRDIDNSSRMATLKGTSKAAYLNAAFDRYGHKGRIVIDLWYTGQLSARDVWGYGATHEKITVSGTKDADEIAADIKRRILPRLAASIEKADTVIKSRNNYQDKLEANVKALGGKGKDKNGNIDHTVHFDGGSADIVGDSVRFTLYSVDIKTAKKIIALLKGSSI